MVCGRSPIPPRRPAMTTPTRRHFLAAASATALAAGRAPGANDAIRVACIGTGGRCRGLMQSLAKIDGVRIVAVCDVWDVALDQARKLADPKADAVKEFRRLLERKDIDAVLIGSPDHWHVPMTVAA